jgi:hypothetical protein
MITDIDTIVGKRIIFDKTKFPLESDNRVWVWARKREWAIVLETKPAAEFERIMVRLQDDPRGIEGWWNYPYFFRYEPPTDPSREPF